MTLALPLAPAFLQQPQTGDVFQETDRVGNTTFVGEVQRQ